MVHITRFAFIFMLTLTKASLALEVANIDIIKQVISEQGGILKERIDEDKPLSTYGIDALECYEIIMALEENLNITIPDSIIEKTIGPYEPKPGLGPSKSNSIAEKLTVNKLAKIVKLATKQ